MFRFIISQPYEGHNSRDTNKTNFSRFAIRETQVVTMIVVVLSSPGSGVLSVSSGLKYSDNDQSGGAGDMNNDRSTQTDTDTIIMFLISLKYNWS